MPGSVVPEADPPLAEKFDNVLCFSLITEKNINEAFWQYHKLRGDSVHFPRYNLCEIKSNFYYLVCPQLKKLSKLKVCIAVLARLELQCFYRTKMA